MLARQVQKCRVQALGRQRRPTLRVLAPRCSAEPAVAQAKRAAARVCVDRFVRNNSLLALGPGEMTALVIAEVGRRLVRGGLQGVVGVPVSDVAANEAAFHGVPLVSEARAREAAVVLADADQLDLAANAALLGCSCEPQQPDLPRLLAAMPPGGNGPKLILLTDSSRVVTRLSGSLPVWLDATTWEEPAEELDDMFLGDAEIWRRSFQTDQPADPRGGDLPYISSEGLTIVDVRFYEGLKLYGEDEPYDKIVNEIGQVSGVVAHGLVVGRAAAAVVARPGQETPQVVEWGDNGEH